jgi:hypothetical protein
MYVCMYVCMCIYIYISVFLYSKESSILTDTYLTPLVSYVCVCVCVCVYVRNYIYPLGYVLENVLLRW